MRSRDKSTRGGQAMSIKYRLSIGRQLQSSCSPRTLLRVQRLGRFWCGFGGILVWVGDDVGGQEELAVWHLELELQDKGQGAAC